MLKTVIKRVLSIHTLENHKNSHGDGTLQGIVESYALRALAVGGAALYHSSPKFKRGLDLIMSAVSGG